MIKLTNETLTITTPQQAHELYRCEQMRERYNDSIQTGKVSNCCNAPVMEGDICSRCKEGCVPEINQ